MYKVATITFHHAYNFGSVLQAYALQEYVKAIGLENGVKIDYRIIDFYSKRQEELYRVYKSDKSAKSLVKNLISFPYAKELKERNKRFENFLKLRCNLTVRYTTEAQLRESYPEADCYISGSDQLWNVRATDFSPAFYLGFLPNNCRRISYAASLGPLPIDWSKYDSEGCKNALAMFSCISVREQGSKDNIAAISDVNCQIHVDPTLLLKEDAWRNIQSDANYMNGKYILLYCLEPSKEQLKMAEAVSDKLRLPIVVLRYNNRNDMFNHFVKKYDSGPEDFLAYIDHAALVLSSSFHGTAFSMIYHKPFYCLHGMKDNRIRSILEMVGAVDRSLETMADVNRISLEKPDGLFIDKMLNIERQKSAEYLRVGLKIG